MPTDRPTRGTTRGTAVDGLLLAVGTLTVARVSPPSAVDRRRGAWAMSWAPLVGVALGVVAGGVTWVAGVVGTPALAGVAAIAVGALVTRAMHLDGLADVADALGSGRRGEAARAVLKDPRSGAFAVVTVALVLAAQVAAVAALVEDDALRAAVGVALATVAARGTLPVACRRPPGSRWGSGGPGLGSGLGSTVVGTVPWVVAAAWVVAVTAAATVFGFVGVLAGSWWAGPGAVAVGFGAAEGMRRRCLTRFDAVTGDVLGAGVEVAMTAALVVLAVAM